MSKSDVYLIANKRNKTKTIKTYYGKKKQKTNKNYTLVIKKKTKLGEINPHSNPLSLMLNFPRRSLKCLI